MKISVTGDDARAAAIRQLLADGGYTVDVFSEQSTPSPADVLVLAGPRNAAAEPASGVPASTILIDAMGGHPDAATERELGRRYGTNRILRALIVLPQRGANILCCSDDAQTMQLVSAIFRACGCVPTDRGPLAKLDQLEPDETLDDQYERLKGANTVPNP